MLTYLLDKFAKIKKDRALYCSEIEEDIRNKENTRNKEDTKNKEKKENMPIIYDFFCKNTRKN
jgi:hypothetical protein